MPHAPVTSLYAALLILLFVALSARVIALRRAGGIAIGVVGAPDLERAARVHGNCAEYAPIALLALLLVELSGTSAWALHALGITLLIGRLAHAFGVSRVPEDFRFRTAGMALSFVTLVGAAALLLLADLAGVTL